MRLSVDENQAKNRTVAIILAAGRAKRLGFPKALLKFPDGRTILDDQVARLIAANLSQIRVVLGAYVSEIKETYKEPNVEWVVNQNFEYGPFSSILSAINDEDDFSGALILPIDTAGVSPETMRKIVSEGSLSQIPVVPQFEARGGHPVYLPAGLIKKMRQLDIASARLDRVLAGEKVARLETTDSAILHNINSKDDWNDFITKTKNA